MKGNALRNALKAILFQQFHQLALSSSLQVIPRERWRFHLEIMTLIWVEHLAYLAQIQVVQSQVKVYSIHNICNIT